MQMMIWPRVLATSTIFLAVLSAVARRGASRLTLSCFRMICKPAYSSSMLLSVKCACANLARTMVLLLWPSLPLSRRILRLSLPQRLMVPCARFNLLTSLLANPLLDGDLYFKMLLHSIADTSASNNNCCFFSPVVQRCSPPCSLALCSAVSG